MPADAQSAAENAALPPAAAPTDAPDAPTAKAGDDEGPSMMDRAKAIVEGYEHALRTNSPRSEAELAELKAVLLS